MELVYDLALFAEVGLGTIVSTTVVLAVICGALASLIVVSDKYLNDYGECELDVNGGEMTLKVNDRVLFSSYAGSEIKLDGNDYLIMSEDEVLAVID